MSYKSEKDFGDQENVRPLFTKVVDQAESGLSDPDMDQYPFHEYEYLNRATELHRHSGHFSLIPRSLQEQ